MIKLGWMKDTEKNTQEYYYDENTNQVYEICLASYNAGIPIKLTPGIAVTIVGPTVTIIGKLFNLKQFDLSVINIILFAVFITIGCYFISRSYDKSEEKKFNYIKTMTTGNTLNSKEILQLYKGGRRFRYGGTCVIALCTALLFFWIWVYSTERNVTSIICIYLCSFCIFIIMKIIAPVKVHKIIKREKKRIHF